MKPTLGAVIVVFCWFACGVVCASEESTRLYTRGLVDFHAGRYSAALAVFDRAVAADANDPYARYYRAVTRARLHDTDGAVSDLRAALAVKPGFDQAALELGGALVERGAYREALPWLQQAQRTPDTQAEASLFLGIAQLRLGDLTAAQQSFDRAASDPKQRLAARYYAGVVAYRANNWAQAEPLFAEVIGAAPESEMTQEARRFLDRIHQGSRNRWQLYGAVGFQYDSNVLLAPANEVIKQAAEISRQADGRFTLGAAAAYTAWEQDHTELSLGYDFYQSLHLHLTEFNLEDHGPSIQLVTTGERLQFGILGRYDYYLLSTHNFLQEGTALPWIAVNEDRGRTEVLYRMRRRDFFDSDFTIRDAFNHSAGVRQLFYLDGPERNVSAGYRFDHEAPVHGGADARQFAYNGQEVSAGAAWTLPAGVAVDLSYAYRYENYAQPSNGRHDDQHNVVVVVRKALTEHLTVVGAYFGTINNSNNNLGDKRFDYERHIGSLALEARI